MQTLSKNCRPVILCIGTTKVTGDSLGPLVGDILCTKYDINAYIYGKSSQQITGLNFVEYIRHIENNHGANLIIAVDACLGAKEDIGKIKYTMNGLLAGSALNKSYGRVGDFALLGIVGEKGEDNLYELMSADKNLVTELAHRIAKKIFFIIKGMDLRLNYNCNSILYK